MRRGLDSPRGIIEARAHGLATRDPRPDRGVGAAAPPAGQERRRARRLGGPEGERLEAEAKERLQEISHHIDDLRSSLE
jgi:hypothetical protein